MELERSTMEEVMMRQCWCARQCATCDDSGRLPARNDAGLVAVKLPERGKNAA